VRLPGIGSTPTLVSLVAHIDSSIGTGADHRIFVHSSKVPGPAHTRLGGRDSLPSSIDDGGITPNMRVKSTLPMIDMFRPKKNFNPARTTTNTPK
jgi:hypothetical protein